MIPTVRFGDLDFWTNGDEAPRVFAQGRVLSKQSASPLVQLPRSPTPGSRPAANVLGAFPRLVPDSRSRKGSMQPCAALSGRIRRTDGAWATTESAKAASDTGLPGFFFLPNCAWGVGGAARSVASLWTTFTLWF